MKRLIEDYLDWRLNGRRNFKPPMGWHNQYYPPDSFFERVAYNVRFRWWKFENMLLNRYGREIQNRWDHSMIRDGTVFVEREIKV